MRITNDQAKLLALCMVKDANWQVIAREAQRFGGLERLWSGQEAVELSDDAVATAAAVHAARGDLQQLREDAVALAQEALDAGVALCTVNDEAYPATLRLVYNLPPFLFVRGQLRRQDLLSVAVVGTRRASDAGRGRAADLARSLCERDVTVVSGLARGIDTAAHRAALEAGGRTVAVVGTGILRCYPAENRALAEEIASRGAVVSQFWPATPPAPYTFPRRNITMSGLAQGTAVIEATAISGAKMQARLALEHGKKVFLLRTLTEDQPWAMKYVQERGAVLVDEVEDIVTVLASPEKIDAADARRAQLAFQFG
jgi:DNA processing protein